LRSTSIISMAKSRPPFFTFDIFKPESPYLQSLECANIKIILTFLHYYWMDCTEETGQSKQNQPLFELTPNALCKVSSSPKLVTLRSFSVIVRSLSLTLTIRRAIQHRGSLRSSGNLSWHNSYHAQPFHQSFIVKATVTMIQPTTAWLIACRVHSKRECFQRPRIVPVVDMQCARVPVSGICGITVSFSA